MAPCCPSQSCLGVEMSETSRSAVDKNYLTKARDRASFIALSVVGTIIDEPVLQRDNSGRLVLHFDIHDTQERFVHEYQRYAKPKPVRHRIIAFDSLAEHAAASLHPGDEVMVIGEMIDRGIIAGPSTDVRIDHVIAAGVIGP